MLYNVLTGRSNTTYQKLCAICRAANVKNPDRFIVENDQRIQEETIRLRKKHAQEATKTEIQTPQIIYLSDQEIKEVQILAAWIAENMGQNYVNNVLGRYGIATISEEEAKGHYADLYIDFDQMRCAFIAGQKSNNDSISLRMNSIESKIDKLLAIWS